jgi:hypothetical protein
MAGTVAASVTLTVRNGDVNDNTTLNCSGVVQTTQGKAGGIQVVGTTHEALDVGDVATNGWIIAQNLDATNFVELGRDVSAAFYGTVRIEPGEIAALRLSQATIYAQADTASVRLFYALYED